MFLNTKYSKFGLASSVVRTSRVSLGSVKLPRTEWRKSGNSTNSNVLDNVSQLASAAAIFLTVFTD